MLRYDRRWIVGLERRFAGDQLVEHRPERVQVRARVRRPSERLLGRQVRDGPDQHPLDRLARALVGGGEPEVAELGGAVLGVLGWAGIAGIGLAAVAFSSGTPFPGYAAVLPALATGFVIAAGLRENGHRTVAGLEPEAGGDALKEARRLGCSHVWQAGKIIPVR